MEEKTMNYAVVFVYSFDEDVAVYLFETFEKARDFLRESYEEELRIDQEENGWDAVGEINEDGSRAKITDRFHDHDNVTEMFIGNIYQ